MSQHIDKNTVQTPDETGQCAPYNMEVCWSDSALYVEAIDFNYDNVINNDLWKNGREFRTIVEFDAKLRSWNISSQRDMDIVDEGPGLIVDYTY